MRQVGKPIKLLVSLVIAVAVLNSGSVAFGHYVRSIYPRAEYVHEPFPAQSPNVNTVQGHIGLNSQPVPAYGDWIWTAASMTRPPAGHDCHSDDISSSQYRVMRVGWMRKNHPDWNNGAST